MMAQSVRWLATGLCAVALAGWAEASSCDPVMDENVLTQVSGQDRQQWLLRRDGQLQLRDCRSHQVLHSVQLAGKAITLASSPDQSVLAVAMAEPGQVHFFDGQLQLLQTLTVATADNTQAGFVSAIHVFDKRQSFVLVLENVPEVWEISYFPRAPLIAIGKVHDFHYQEGAFIPGYLNPSRTRLPAEPVKAWLLPEEDAVLLQFSRDEPEGALYHLDVRRAIERRAMP